MRLSDVLEQIGPVVGLTSLIAAPGSVGTPASEQPSLAQAKERLADLRAQQEACTSDAAYWGYGGQISYWRCVVDLLEAAEVTGPDSLPDVAFPEGGGLVMDSMYNLEKFGQEVREAALAR